MSLRLLNSASIATIHAWPCLCWHYKSRHPKASGWNYTSFNGRHWWFCCFCEQLVTCLYNIHIHLKTRQRKETNIALFPHWGLTTLSPMKIHTRYMIRLLLPILMIETTVQTKQNWVHLLNTDEVKFLCSQRTEDRAQTITTIINIVTRV